MVGGARLIVVPLCSPGMARRYRIMTIAAR